MPEPAAKTFRPEVVLLDIGLPERNGYEGWPWPTGAAWPRRSDKD